MKKSAGNAHDLFSFLTTIINLMAVPVLVFTQSFSLASEEEHLGRAHDMDTFALWMFARAAIFVGLFAFVTWVTGRGLLWLGIIARPVSSIHRVVRRQVFWHIVLCLLLYVVWLIGVL